MKAKHIFGLIMIVLLLLCLAKEVPSAKVDSMPDLLRLHVRANSDLPADQALKYEVRDTILDTCEVYLSQANNVREAQEQLSQVLPVLLDAAEATVHNAGFNYTVTGNINESFFPTRMYGTQVYRAGKYLALQIYIGEGKGENWWCVLFPPLCFVEVSGDKNIPVSLDNNDVPRPRFRLLEWWQSLFGSCRKKDCS